MTRPADPGSRLSADPLPRILRGRHTCWLRWLLPPFACVIHFSRLVAAPRYFGPETIPRSPWPSLHLAFVGAALVAAQLLWLDRTKAGALFGVAGSQVVDWKTAGETGSSSPGWQGTAAGLLAKLAGAAETVVLYLSDHLDIVLPALLVYLVSFGLAHFLFGVNRLRRRGTWVKIRDLMMYLKGAEMPVLRHGRRAHDIVNTLFLLATILLLASGWWLVIPSLPPHWGIPELVGGLPLGWVASGVAAAIWLALFVLAVRPRFASLVADTEAPEAVIHEEDIDLPELTLDGSIPIPQLSPRSPLQEIPRGLDVIPGDRAAARRFATLTAIGQNEECRYVAAGNAAAPTLWQEARLEVAGGDAWWEGAPEKPKPEFTMPTPADLTESLCRLMYQASAVDGVVGKRHNAVIRDFCLSHTLCLMVPEEELTTILGRLAEAEWPRCTGEQTAVAIQSAFDGFDVLPTIEEYLVAWRDHQPAATSRIRAGDFDPLRNGCFNNLEMDFTTLGRGLVQSVIFADRRIDSGESELARRLGLGGDFESDVEPAEVTP